MKKYIIGFIIGAIIFSGVSVIAYNIGASSISFEPTDDKWNVTNVKDAIDDLYNRSNLTDLIWYNKDNSAIAPTTINIDLSKYKSIIVLGYYVSSYSGYTGYVKINVGSSGTLRTYYNPTDCPTRNFVVNTNSIEIKEGRNWNGGIDNSQALPIYIFGIK